MLLDPELLGPPNGIGSMAHVKTKVGGRTGTIDIEVIAAERPRTTLEQNVGANGRRTGTGTYTLEPLPSGGTRINFGYAWQQTTVSERLFAPLARAYLRTGNTLAMQRLAEMLDARLGSPQAIS